MKRKFLVVSTLALQIGLMEWVQAAMFNYSGAVVHYTIPDTATYEITAAGAQGGSSDFTAGGSGVTLDGDVNLTAGTVLDVVVGGEGTDGIDGFGSAGGGGGTFVYADGSNIPLLVAGGGGGVGYSALSVGSAAQTGHAGQSGVGADGGAGGTFGSGGGAGTSREFDGAGGAGWNYIGISATGEFDTYVATGGHNAPSFAGGQGDGRVTFAVGGFGGGGGGGEDGGGGGGGYSGGGGGDGSVSPDGGGGGGSYVNTTFTDITYGANSGNGSVTITAISVPEPASVVSVGVFLACGLGRGRRRRAIV